MNLSSPRAIAATIVVIVSGGGVFLILPLFIGALVATGGLDNAQAGAVGVRGPGGHISGFHCGAGAGFAAPTGGVSQTVSLVIMIAGKRRLAFSSTPSCRCWRCAARSDSRRAT